MPSIGPPPEGFPPRGKLSAERTDEGKACDCCLFTGGQRRAAPHPASVGASATFPRGGRLLGDTPQFHNQSSRFVMLFRLTPSVDALCKSADVAGGRMPMAPRTMRVLLKLMIKR